MALKVRANEVMSMVDEAGHGTGRLPTDLISKLELGVPSLEEQRRITDVLDALDESIATTSNHAERLTSLRTALREELLRRASGSPRLTLGEISVAGGQYGSNSSAVPYDERLPRYVRITDVDDEGAIRPGGAVSIPRPGVGRYLLEPGDLLIARTGFTTGKSYLHRMSAGDYAFAGYLIRFRINPSIALPEFVFEWTKCDEFARWIGGHIHEVGQRNISAREYATCDLPVPPIDAQASIAGRLQEISSDIMSARARVRKQTELRQGLMEDLLTGRVRVSDPSVLSDGRS
jgi:type I restriction enzyme S subunit